MKQLLARIWSWLKFWFQIWRKKPAARFPYTLKPLELCWTGPNGSGEYVWTFDRPTRVFGFQTEPRKDGGFTSSVKIGGVEQFYQEGAVPLVLLRYGLVFQTVKVGEELMVTVEGYDGLLTPLGEQIVFPNSCQLSAFQKKEQK